MNGATWYLIHCKPREDVRALEHLERQGFQCYLPMMRTEKRRQGRVVGMREPLFPRYLFIHLNETESNWYPIRSTRGVSQLVCCNGKPVPVHDAIVESIRARLQAEPVKTPYLKRGEAVQITEGPFCDIEAIFLANDGEERVVLLLNIMHTEQQMVFPIERVRKVG